MQADGDANETAYAVTLARALTNYQSKVQMQAKGEGTANAMTHARAKYQSEVQMEAIAAQKPPKTRQKRENNWESKNKAQDLKPRK